MNRPYSHRGLDAPRPHYRAVLWHRFGTDQPADQEIFFAGEKPNLFLGILHSPEAKLLAYQVFSAGRYPLTSLYLHSPETGGTPRLLLHDLEGCFVPFFVRDQLFACTNLAAPNFRIVSIDVSHPEPEHWCNIAPESDKCIQHFAVAADKIFVTRADRFSTKLEAFDIDGKSSEETRLPPHTRIDLINPTTSTDQLFYTQSSIVAPATLYCYDSRKRQTFTLDKSCASIDPSEFIIEELTYESKDGTTVPLLLAARNDLLDTGPLPTFITAYGGFGICVIPRFTAFATFLIEQGCLFAVPALRGGSELGEGWHQEGCREKRQNSFNDFIAAAEWLISQGRSAPGRIAAGGGSNAGLLVGAVITQRPDLFRAAICLGSLLDMIRYHLFDSAVRWADEYGSAEDADEFHSLITYSPYHRVEDGTNYPAVLVISGDADTRCNAMHSRKMAARLQAANKSGHPVLLDYRPAWGHTSVQPVSVKMAALADRLAFVCNELGITHQLEG